MTRGEVVGLKSTTYAGAPDERLFCFTRYAADEDLSENRLPLNLSRLSWRVRERLEQGSLLAKIANDVDEYTWYSASRVATLLNRFEHGTIAPATQSAPARPPTPTP
ncbi:hypothetical protein ACTVCO_05475 [Sanguibacter sp. A247]|uniref:hypothetical protein n=1 Tax=unclassified Sanguibacter TaxID=2645534 RepID=UPI003FD7AA45